MTTGSVTSMIVVMLVPPVFPAGSVCDAETSTGPSGKAVVLIPPTDQVPPLHTGGGVTTMEPTLTCTGRPDSEQEPETA